MDYYEFVDVVKLMKLYNKYIYDKNYKLLNKQKQNNYALQYYYRTVETQNGRLNYNNVKKLERLNRKIKNFVNNGL
jgi:hypothetical protein